MREMVSIGLMKIRKGERIFLAIGITLLAVWGGARIHGSVASHAAINLFRAKSGETQLAGKSALLKVGSSADSGVDFTLWNPKRVAAYKESLSTKTDLPLALLRIPKIHLEVPVFNDTDDLTLNRGVGRILGTAQFGRAGNLGIAGHRDGFFRGLKDVGPDDVIEVIRPGQTDFYAITQIQIVDPENVSVLAPTSTQTLTLVTCYPFYFIGNAPQRYIVTASYQVSDRVDVSVSTESFSTGKKINKKEKQDEVK